MERPENQDWQRQCTKCGRVTCPTPEKVAEWMRDATGECFKWVERFASEDPERMGGWREQAGKYSVMMELVLASWSRCLEGICMDCQSAAFPSEHERLDDPEGMAGEHWRRWAFVVPLVAEQRERDAIRAEVLADVAATGPVGESIAADLRPPATWKVRTKEGEQEVPCAWKRDGLVVVMLGEATLEKAKADRAAGKEGAYPTQHWTVTHAASGMAVAQSYDTADGAIEAARRLLPVVDWTLPMEQVTEAVKASKEAQRAISLERWRTGIW